MFRVHGEWGDEVWDGVAEGWAGSRRSVSEGDADGAFAIRLKLKVEVLPEWAGVVCGSRAVEVVLVDDGDATSMLFDSVLGCVIL